MEAITGKGPLRVAIHQHECRAEDNASTRLDRLDRAITEAARRGADLLICPELFLSGYDIGVLVRERAEPFNGPGARRAAGLAAQHGVALVYGYPERDGKRLFNSALCLGKDGELLANHRKRRLPNEFERTYFERGETATSFLLDGWRIAIVICYEVEFPEAVRRAALDSAALIVTPTALVEDWGVVAHRVIPTRAFENCIYVAYANYAGREGNSRYLGASVVAGPRGDDCARATAGEELIVGELDPKAIGRARERLPFLRDHVGL